MMPLGIKTDPTPGVTSRNQRNRDVELIFLGKWLRWEIQGHIGPLVNSLKLKKFADNKFDYDENGIKFSKRVENTVGKG